VAKGANSDNRRGTGLIGFEIGRKYASRLSGLMIKKEIKGKTGPIKARGSLLRGRGSKSTRNSMGGMVTLQLPGGNNWSTGG